MAVSAGDAYLDVHARLASDTGRSLSRQFEGPASRAGQEASRHFGRKFAAGLAVSGAVIGVGLVKATRLATRGILATTEAASALNEQVNKSNAIFGNSSKEIQRWAKGAASSFGQSERQALSAASTFGDMFLQLKVGRKPATDMSKSMVELASDLASFSDADITQVLEAQQAAFRGEYDSLQRFIPGINAARVEQVALNQTHKKSAKDLTQAEKALATYTIITKDAHRASGDFARTLKTSLANQQRQAAAKWENLTTKIGKSFLPAQLAVTRALNEKLLPALGQLVRTYGPGVQRTVTRWANAFAASIPTSKQLSLGLEALSAAYREGDVTSDGFVGTMERIGVAAHNLVGWFRNLRTSFRGVGQGVSELGPAFAQAGGAGHLFANSLAIVGPVLEVVARNIHNIIPWLPTLLGGFLAFRAVRSVVRPIGDLGQAIANFTSPATAVATFLNARANKALAAALTERAIAESGAARAAGTDAVATTAAGNAASGAAGKVGLFSAAMSSTVGKLGLFAAAAAAGAYQGHQLAEAAAEGTRVSGPFAEQRAKILRTLGLEATAASEAVSAQRGLAAATAAGASTADRYTGSVRAQKQAIDVLKGTLRGEESAEIEVRQAKLNVATAQQRLTELTKAGRKGSLDYKQAQIDLRRAQIDLKQRTDEYKDAQQRASAATKGAMQATQRAQGPYKTFGETARTAGLRALTMGHNAREGIGLIPNRSVKVTANYNTTAPKGIELLIEKGLVRRARGGPVWGAGTTSSDSIPAMLSNQEHVWDAAAVKGAGGGSFTRGHRRLNAMRAQARGYAAGGPVLDFRQIGTREFLARPGRFDRNIARSLEFATRGFGILVRQFKDQIFGVAGMGRGLAWARAHAGAPYLWGGVGPFGWDCSGWISSITNAIKGAPTGRRLFSTASFSPGATVAGFAPGLGPVGGFNIGVFRGSPGHMAGTIQGINVESRGSRGTLVGAGARGAGDRIFSMRFHLTGTPTSARPGSGDAPTEATGLHVLQSRRFDRGGWLAPHSATLAVNRTRHWERVGPPGEGGIHVTVNLNGPVLGAARQVARELAPELETQLRKVGYQSGRR